MKLRWGALVVVLVLSALMPRVLTAQGTQSPSRERKAGVLKQNYPNPFNPETRIPFSIGDEKCEDPGRQHRVSLRIYNILSQLVAVPVLARRRQPDGTYAEETLTGGTVRLTDLPDVVIDLDRLFGF